MMEICHDRRDIHPDPARVVRRPGVVWADGMVACTAAYRMRRRYKIMPIELFCTSGIINTASNASADLCFTQARDSKAQFNIAHEPRLFCNPPAVGS